MEDGWGNAPFIPPSTAASFCTESGILTLRQVAPGNGLGEPCGVGGGGGEGYKRYSAPGSRAAGKGWNGHIWPSMLTLGGNMKSGP